MAKQPSKDPPATVAELLAAIGVKRIVYVDDWFGVTTRRVLDLCNDLSVETLAASGVFADVDLPVDDDAGLGILLEQRIAEMDQEGCEQAYRKLLQARSPGGIHVKDQKATKALAELVASGAALERLSRAIWVERQPNLVEESKELPTLFVFDDDFTLEGHGRKEGRRLIADLHVRFTEMLAGDAERSKHAYVLLTHNASNDEDELRLENEIIAEAAALQGFVVVMAKNKLADDERRFIHRLKSTLLFRFFRIVKAKLAAATELAHAEAKARISDLSVEAFERIVFGSSHLEGAWSPETLARIYAVKYERQVRSLLRADAALHQLVVDVDPLCRVAAGRPSEAVANTARALQRSEIYDAPEDVNALYLPLELGDIFEHPDGKTQYVVLAQPCDLVLRSNGFRRGKDRDQQQLVALATVVGHRLSGAIEIKAFEHPLPYFEEEGRQYYAWLNNPVLVPVWLLDLAVLNDQGECSIAAGQPWLKLLPSPWQQRCAVIADRAKRVVEFWDGAGVTEAEPRAALLHALLRLPAGSPFQPTLTPVAREPGANWELRIGLRRVGRLRERYSTGMLAHYGAWMTRFAEPHDLARFA